jgi:very-short-patch-repair endonuclease
MQLVTGLCRPTSMSQRMRLARTSTYRSRALRVESTTAEKILWVALRGRRVFGAKFRRQHPIGPFVVDFFCGEAQLAVEADGASHFPTPPRERDRDAVLAAGGILVLRFSNDEILTDPERVVRVIERHVRART